MSVNLKFLIRVAWVAQSVERLTLDLGSGHDLMVCGFEARIEPWAGSTDPAWDSLSPLPRSRMYSVSK